LLVTVGELRVALGIVLKNGPFRFKLQRKMDVFTTHLQRIISRAALDKDTSLTKKTCRTILAGQLGTTFSDAELAFVNAEINRISALCMEEDTIRVLCKSSVTGTSTTSADTCDRGELSYLKPCQCMEAECDHESKLTSR
jgi:hypothetical protein